MSGHILKDRAYEEDFEFSLSRKDEIARQVDLMVSAFKVGSDVVIGKCSCSPDDVVEAMIEEGISGKLLALAFTDDPIERACKFDEILPKLEEWAEKTLDMRGKE